MAEHLDFVVVLITRHDNFRLKFRDESTAQTVYAGAKQVMGVPVKEEWADDSGLRVCVLCETLVSVTLGGDV